MSSKLLITCREATNFISRNEEHKLSLIQRMKLVVHLMICHFCRLFKKQNDLIINSIVNYSVDESLTEAETKKIERIIEESS